jgi:aminoglycoside phosphotransferase (APT) family kinase protein
VDRAVAVDGIVISFWEYEEKITADRSLTALARLLRTLHAYREIGIDLPRTGNPLSGIAQATDDFPEAFDGDDWEWLSDEIRACAQRWAAMRFVLPAALVNGDAHPNNMLYTRRGVLLGDHVGFGPPEWDLVQAVYFHRRFLAPSDDLDSAARIYGWDLRAWPEIDTLVGIREISGPALVRPRAATPAHSRCSTSLTCPKSASPTLPARPAAST